MSNPECGVCRYQGKRMLARCVQCGQHFCNYTADDSISHLLMHIKATKHVVFDFPGFGIPKCSSPGCDKRNICAMYQDDMGDYFCMKHKTCDSAKIVENNRVNFLLAAPTSDLYNMYANLRNLEKKDFAYAYIALTEMKAMAGDSGFERKLQELNDNLLKMPVSFPQLGKDAYYITGKSFLSRELEKELANGQVVKDGDVYTSTDQKLQHKIDKLSDKEFTYFDFMSRTLKAEFLMRRSKIEESKEPIATSLMQFRTQDGKHFYAFFPWEKFRRLCNQPVRIGDELCIDVVSQNSTERLSGNVIRCVEYLVIRLDTQLPACCMALKLHDVDEIVFEHVRIADHATTHAPSLYQNHTVYRANDDVGYLVKFSMMDWQMVKMLHCAELISYNSRRHANLQIIKGQFSGEVHDAVRDASCGLCTLEQANEIIEKLKKRLKELTTGNAQLFFPNECQLKAIRQALTTSISLIYGCPGGGKTYTSILIVMCLLDFYSDKQILCCAGSNIAADNLAMYALRLGLRIVRVYARSREDSEMLASPIEMRESSLHMIIARKISDNVYVDEGLISQQSNDKIYEYILGNIPFKYTTVDALTLKDYEELEQYELDAAHVIVSTCISSSNMRISRREYAAVLIDETSQIVEPETILPIVCAPKHFVLVGDQNQLGPTIANKKAANAGLQQSLYQRLLRLGIKPARLNKQYRMHPGLLEFPNDNFYAGRITSGINWQARVLKQKAGVQNGVSRILQSSFPSFFWHISFQEQQDVPTKSYLNEREAEVVVGLVKKLQVEYGLKQQQIGVITPYSAQQVYISQLLITHPDVEVNSVDGFQGREKDIIIFSCVRSNEDDQIGFLHEKKRVNVAMTRAKYGFVVVGNALHLWTSKGIWNVIVEFYHYKGALFAGDDIRNLKPFALPRGKTENSQDKSFEQLSDEVENAPH